ncbi:MAG: cardiolipin synthase [Oscillospiraceae bacterium]|nr:cardiolipin synthase [Oscillospiraceae bacterium]
MQKRWVRALFRRRVLVSFLILAQIFFFAYVLISGSKSSSWISWGLSVISILVAVSIINKRERPAYKLTWIFLILALPIVGGFFYLLFTRQSAARRYRRRADRINALAEPALQQEPQTMEQFLKDAPQCAPQVRYLQGYAGFPLYRDTETEYLTPGEAMFQRLVEELEKAERYIFLEYFIIQEGRMWNIVLDILRRKVKQGVDVRLIYDDMGCFLLLPKNYRQQLEAMGIRCTVFNPFQPVLSTIQNNRDHRKITSIDGKVAFTGGINLADEYINEYEKYGHWKDASILLRGRAAWSLTVMFLQMWDLCCRTETDYSRFQPWREGEGPSYSDGYVQPYEDSPLDAENVGEHVYLQMINGARDYLYINTPYLIADDNMISALRLAAKSGVDVRIVTPHCWDKLLVHITTRSYYRELIQSGVRIYEYSKGFLHSKTFVSDDQTATVGTINLDFRSLYLHFECGVWMYGSSAVAEVKQDFLETLEQCQEITMEDCQNNWLMRMFQDILRIFAPLM